MMTLWLGSLLNTGLIIRLPRIFFDNQPIDTRFPMLSDTRIKNAKPKDKPYKLQDEKGMYLLVMPNGSKYFRLNYRFNGKQKTLAIGIYPDTSLKRAREKRDAARIFIADGIDPGVEKKAAKTARLNNFEQIARDWLAATSHQTVEDTAINKRRRFEMHVFPVIGSMGVAEIKPADVSRVVKPLVARKEYASAKRIRSEISAVFGFAIAHGFTEFDPAQSVRGQIPAPKTKHRVAITDPKAVGQLMRDIDAYSGTFIVCCALKLSPLLFQRPGEIRRMQWADIDLDAKEWRYLVTKTNVQHIVPLSTQAILILESIKPATGNDIYVFPGNRKNGKPMSGSTITAALDAMGYGETMTTHGFRTLASTLLNEQGWSPDAIERSLCHMPKDQVRKAYNRAQYLDERRKMMQAWADYLDGLKSGAQVIPIKKFG
jgi:integrase